MSTTLRFSTVMRALSGVRMKPVYSIGLHADLMEELLLYIAAYDRPGGISGLKICV